MLIFWFKPKDEWGFISGVLTLIFFFSCPVALVLYLHFLIGSSIFMVFNNKGNRASQDEAANTDSVTCLPESLRLGCPSVPRLYYFSLLFQSFQITSSAQCAQWPGSIKCAFNKAIYVFIFPTDNILLKHQLYLGKTLNERQCDRTCVSSVMHSVKKNN